MLIDPYRSINHTGGGGRRCVRDSEQPVEAWTSLLRREPTFISSPSKHQHHWSIDRRVPMASIGGGALTGAAASASGASSSLDPKREFRRQVDVTVGRCEAWCVLGEK
jgi:hypothetical protein